MNLDNLVYMHRRIANQRRELRQLNALVTRQQEHIQLAYVRNRVTQLENVEIQRAFDAFRGHYIKRFFLWSGWIHIHLWRRDWVLQYRAR